jgi:hypothetical protein
MRRRKSDTVATLGVRGAEHGRIYQRMLVRAGIKL